MRIITDEHKKRSNAVIAFVKKKELISKHALCKEVGMDASNFSKCLYNPKVHIPEHHLAEFERQLKKYGFEPDHTV